MTVELMNCAKSVMSRPDLFFRKVGATRLPKSSHFLSLDFYPSLSSIHSPPVKVSQSVNTFPTLVCRAVKRPRSNTRSAYCGEQEFGGENLPLQWSSTPKKQTHDIISSQGQRQSNQSVEKLLWEQIRKGEFYNGGGNKRPPRTGGGGDGSGDWDFSGSMQEAVQVFLATIGFVFLYVCIVRGEELARLFWDYIGYLSSGRCTPRLKRAVRKWEMFRRRITGGIGADQEQFYE